MPGLATICVLFSHKANGEKAHKYRLCRHLPSYIGLGLKIVSRLDVIIIQLSYDEKIWYSVVLAISATALLLTLSNNVFASSGYLKSASIKTCPNGNTYGYHGSSEKTYLKREKVLHKTGTLHKKA